MKDIKSIIERLDNCATVADLRAYATDLYASGLLDESEETRSIDPLRGPLSPWSIPASAEILDDAGEDITIRLSSGEVATWRNRNRDWTEADDATIIAAVARRLDDLCAALCADHHPDDRIGCRPASESAYADCSDFPPEAIYEVYWSNIDGREYFATENEAEQFIREHYAD